MTKQQIVKEMEHMNHCSNTQRLDVLCDIVTALLPFVKFPEEDDICVIDGVKYKELSGYGCELCAGFKNEELCSKLKQSPPPNGWNCCRVKLDSDGPAKDNCDRYCDK